MHPRQLFFWFWTIFLSVFSWAQQQKPVDGSSDVTFQNGIHLRILPDDKGHADVNRYLTVKNRDLVYRLFLDSRGRLVFGYDIATLPGSHPNEVKVQVRPLDPEALSLVHSPNDGTVGENGRIPTVQKEMEISTTVGRMVTVNAFTEPSTGVEVRDLIQVTSFESAQSTESSYTELPSPQVASSFDLANVHIWLNGKEITGSKTLQSVSGPFPVLYIPGHGSFFIALGPVGNLNFVQAGSINDKKLEFTAGSDRILCTSSSVILNNRHQALIWVWHEPNYKLSIPIFDAFLGRPKEDRVQIAVADSIDVWRGMVFEPGRSF